MSEMVARASIPRQGTVGDATGCSPGPRQCITWCRSPLALVGAACGVGHRNVIGAFQRRDPLTIAGGYTTIL
jgi:hypothetical protein